MSTEETGYGKKGSGKLAAIPGRPQQGIATTSGSKQISSSKKIETPLTGPNYTVNITLNDQDITAYVDTGSVVSLVTEGFVSKELHLQAQPMSDLGEIETSFTTANGDSLDYVGFVAVDVRIPSVPGVYDCILLVIPSQDYEHVLLGTNILMLLDEGTIKDKSLLRSTRVDRKLANFNTVRTDVKTILKNTVNLCTGKLRVKSAPFVRTV